MEHVIRSRRRGGSCPTSRGLLSASWHRRSERGFAAGKSGGEGEDWQRRTWLSMNFASARRAFSPPLSTSTWTRTQQHESIESSCGRIVSLRPSRIAT